MISEALQLLHEGLARQGPGSEASTRRAIGLLPALPPEPRVLDLACGPGAQTLVLVQTLRAPVTAIDIHQPFLDQLDEAAAELGLADLIETRNLSMNALDDPLESIDLIWCEGAVYLLGVGAALRSWRPFLRARGIVAFTECTWLTESPPPEASAFWAEAYPALATIAGNTATVVGEGYETIATFPLPAEDWWAHYYSPLQKRIDALRGRAAENADWRAVLDETQREIDLFERYGDSYGYVFYLVRKPE
jgi:serine/threonine-protein kinase HipA